MDKTLIDGIGNFLRRAALAFCFCAGTAVATPAVGIHPSLSSVTLGQSFDVAVDVSGVTDLFAFQFDLGFDPSLLAAVSIGEGPFLPAGGVTHFLPGSIDNALGTIVLTIDTLLGPVPGVSGDGTLAIVRFQAIGLGSGPIGLSGVTLLDSDLHPIPFDTAGGSVVVSAAAAPLPGSLWLAVAALAALSARRRQVLPGAGPHR